MSKTKTKHVRNTIAYTIVAIVLLVAVFAFSVTYMYNFTEDECFENLHILTKEIKDDINLQMKSDMENLQTMAGIAANLHITNRDFSLLFDSFKPIGLIENIGILLPDNTVLTRIGSTSLQGKISFEEEAARGRYISGAIDDLTVEGRKIIRMAVPALVNGEAVAVVYGTTTVDSLRERYKDMTDRENSQLFLVERGKKSFIFDTWREEPIPLPSFGERESKEGLSYDDMYEGIISGGNGFASFKSALIDEFMYVHYAPTDIGDWSIMLAVPESVAFESLHKISNILFVMFGLALFIMLAYLILVFFTEYRRSALNSTAADIRRLLLEINHQKSSITDALEHIAAYAKSRTAFFEDTDGVEYIFVDRKYSGDILNGDARDYFVSKLIEYGGNDILTRKTTLNLIRIDVNRKLRSRDIEFYNFCKTHDVKNFIFASIIDKNDHVNIIGTVNARRHGNIRVLLKEIGVCFSIAIFNKKHLNKTETVASTDALTGLSNRVAYKRDVAMLEKKSSDDFACIFIDVNELHSFNNKFGHAAGDGMLLYIAEALKAAFPDGYLYRMGGDEFLIFTLNMKKDAVEAAINSAIEAVEKENYHISIGMVFRTHGIDFESLVKEAEKRMYDAKARYYQQKEQRSIAADAARRFEHTATGITEIDKMLEVISEHYFGIYYVSLENDRARRLVMPSELEYGETEEHFSELLKKYVSDVVHPDSHRVMNAFISYDVLSRQLNDGMIPRVTYKKINGETISLSVHSMEKTEDGLDTVWVFEEA